jgi:hypothetical protein
LCVFRNKTEVTRKIKLTVRKSIYISIIKYGLGILNITVYCKPKELRQLRTIESKTIRERIGDPTIRIELGNIPSRKRKY